MEDNQQVTLPPMERGNGKVHKGIIVFLIILVLALGALVGIMLSNMSDQKKKAAEVQEILEGQKDRLEIELTDMQDQFGALQTNNDSLKDLAYEQQNRISRLLTVQADNLSKIKMYEKELGTLREVLRSYIIQVDSLNQRNLTLTAERTELTKNLAAERAQTTRLAEDKEKLATTVQMAQVLSIADILTVGLNGRSRETPRVRNIEKLRTCFTVRENQVATAGERTFYLIIIKPDKTVLGNRTNSTFTTQDGDEIVYSANRTIEYENKDIEQCIFSDSEGQLTAGNYEAKIYCDGYLVGSSTFALR